MAAGEGSRLRNPSVWIARRRTAYSLMQRSIGTPAPAERHWNFFGHRGGGGFFAVSTFSGVGASGSLIPASILSQGSAQIPFSSSLPFASCSLRQTCSRPRQSLDSLQEIPRKMVRESGRGPTLAGLRLATLVVARALPSCPAAEIFSGTDGKVLAPSSIAAPRAAAGNAKAVIASNPALDAAPSVVRKIFAKPRSENFFSLLGAPALAIRCASA
jgi:hypothetical protein